MKRPNLFTHARSELAQDAIIAYLLEWANPYHRTVNPKMNDLALRLLNAMLLECGITVESIRSVDVKTQENQVDITVRINDEVILLIEDKIDTFEHSNQISRYKSDAAKKYPDARIYILYIKTGNEARAMRPEGADGAMYRKDLLKALGNHSQTNDIVDEFVQHLRGIERDTQSYAEIPICEWSWRDKEERDKEERNKERCYRAMEGYYMALEQQLNERFGRDDDLSWQYVNNRTGGFLGFWWHWRDVRIDDLNACVYLQIEDARKLTVRLGDATKDEKESRVEADHMWSFFERLQNHARQYTSLSIEKAGRFRGGKTGAVAEVGFPDAAYFGRLEYMAADANGCLNMAETMNRLDCAMQLVDAVAEVRPA